MVLIRALQRQRNVIRYHLVTSLLVAVTVAGVLYLGYVHHEVSKAVAYLLALWLCTLVTDMFTINKKPAALPVKKPMAETLLAVGLTLLGIAGLMFRFVWLDWEWTAGLLKLAVLPLVLLCAFPIALAGILLLMRYRPKDLGFRLRSSAFLGFFIVGIVAATALIFAPSGFTFKLLLAETGSIGGIFVMGFVVAALPEEFTRLAIQTRLGALLHNNALGWFFACVIWAFMHSPKWYGQSGDLFEALMGAVRIIPLGLMWSYLIHRTKSIFPSLIAHGLNVWGLQNF